MLLRNQLFWLFAIFIILAAIFYPRYYLISDEHHYARTAHLLGNEGTTKVDYLHGGIFHETNGAYSSKYPIGLPLLMALFSLLGIDGLFLVNILLHLIASYCFALILRARKISTLYTALYLFFPLFAYYAVSLFADFTAASLIIIFYYFIAVSQWKHRGLLSGIILTLIMYTRPVVLMFAIPFYVKWLRDLRQGKQARTITQSLYVFVPFVFLFASFSLIPIMMGYNTGDPEGNTLWIIDNPAPVKNFFQNLFYQLELLFLVYPAMVLLLLNVKRQHIQGALLYILLFGFVDYTANVTKFVGVTSLTRHVRYLLPVIAILLPDYCYFLDKILQKTKKAAPCLLFLGIVFLIISSGVLLFLHQKATQRNRIMMQDIYASTTEDSIIVSNTLAYLMYDSLGKRKYLGIDDYTETLNGVRTYTLGRNESMTSVEYLSSFIEQNPSFIVITKGKYINDIPESQEKLRILIDKFDGELVYRRAYGCTSCFGTVDTLSIELYNLTTTSPS